jgi:hypothetical protein
MFKPEGKEKKAMGLEREYLHMDNNARGKKTTPGENTTHSTTTNPTKKKTIIKEGAEKPIARWWPETKSGKL